MKAIKTTKQLHRLFSVFLMIAIVALFPFIGYGQITANWFDINPDKSNLDADNPNGASGGRINKLGAASDMSRIYATSEWGGLYTSFNQGVTWVKIETFSPSTAWDVKVIPGSRTVIVTSFFDGRAVNPQSGISISRDAGATWNTVPWPNTSDLICNNANAQTSPSAWQIAINPTNAEEIYVGTNCGLAVSDDGGANWNFIDPTPGDNAEQIYAVEASGDFVDVVGDNGYLRSSNSATTFTPPLAPGAQGPNANVSGSLSTLARSPAENYVLYASTGQNIFETVDAGITWPTSLTFPGNAQGRIPFVKTNQLSTSSQYDVWFGDINVFKTTATVPSPSSIGGPQRAPTNSWASMQAGAHADVGDILFDTRFLSGACPTCFANDGGVYRNTRNVNPLCQIPNWEQPEISPHGTWLYGMDGAQLAQNVHGVYYGLQDNGLWGANNALIGTATPGWSNTECCDVVDLAAQTNLFLYPVGVFPTGRAFRIFKRDADQSDPEEIPNYPSAGILPLNWSSSDRIVRFGNNSFALGLTDGVHITSNIASNSINWNFLGAPPVPAGATTFIGGLKTANVGGTRNFYAYTGTDPETPGQLFNYSGTSPGGTWSPLNLPLGVGSISVFDVDPTNGNRVIISGISNPPGNQFGMWMTRDFGANWAQLPELDTLMTGNGTFANPNTFGRTQFTLGFGTTWQPSLVKFNPLDPSTIIAGAADSGVFISLDDGNNWDIISTPISPTSSNPHIPRPMYAYFSPGRFNSSTTSFDVWVGTRGAGVQKVLIDVEDNED